MQDLTLFVPVPVRCSLRPRRGLSAASAIAWGVVVVVLLPAHERAHVGRHQQPHRTTLGAQSARQIMSAATGFHRNTWQIQPCHRRQHAVPLASGLVRYRPTSVQLNQMKDILANINAHTAVARVAHGILLHSRSHRVYVKCETSGSSHWT